MAEHRELGDVAAEEERHGPVGDDPELARDERELEEVVRPRDEPAEEAAEAQAEHVGDPLVAAERRHLAEHPVAVRLRLAPEVLRQPPGLAERVLAGRRVGLLRRRLVGDAGAVAERPDVLAALDPQRRAHEDSATLVQRAGRARRGAGWPSPLRSRPACGSRSASRRRGRPRRRSTDSSVVETRMSTPGARAPGPRTRRAAWGSRAGSWAPRPRAPSAAGRSFSSG